MVESITIENYDDRLYDILVNINKPLKNSMLLIKKERIAC
jgi:hypothetical protein